MVTGEINNPEGLRSASYHPDLHTECVCTILIGEDALRFAIFRLANGELIRLGVIGLDSGLNRPASIHQALDLISSGNKDFRSIKSAVYGAPFTVIPGSLSHEDLGDLALKISTGDEEGSSRFRRLNARNVAVSYLANESDRKAITDYFPGGSQELRLSHALEFSQAPTPGTPYIDVFLGGSKLETLVYSGKDELLLANIFDAESGEDVLYYLGQLCAVHDWENTSVELLLSGDLDQGSMVRSQLARFFRIAEHLYPDGYVIDEEFPKSHVISHLALDPCAS